MKFPLGKTVATAGAFHELERAGLIPALLLDRHANGDWGEINEQDRQANEYAMKHALRVLSAYILKSGQKIWIITEADRSTTTILLPEEY